MKTLFKIIFTDKVQILVIADTISDAEERVKELDSFNKEISNITYVAKEIKNLDTITKTNCLIVV